MSISLSTEGAVERTDIEYPDSDGRPIADNTLQFEWINTIKWNLEALFRDDPEVFVAGDLLWYPVEGAPNIRVAPDVLVAFGRPKGYRGSYRQWREDGIAPQVVWEILSPSNRSAELVLKSMFYDRHGVEEYYVYDPETFECWGMRRDGGFLANVPQMNGWVSPRLGIRFQVDEGELKLFLPDGRPFMPILELAIQRDVAEAERQRADTERQRAERLEEQLRALGIEPAA